jgi:hypothetical protein
MTMPAFRAPKLDCGELSKWAGKAPALHLTLQKGRGRVRHPGRQTPRKNPTTATAARSATSQLELRDVILCPTWLRQKRGVVPHWDDRARRHGPLLPLRRGL